MDTIFIRRSIRKYLNKPVEKGKIEKIIKAAMQAPSAGNQRPWEFIVIQDRILLQELSLVSPYAAPLKTANAAIIVLGNMEIERVKFPECVPQDLAAATQNLLLQAVELALGTVWLGVVPVKERVEYIQKMFTLPGHVIPFSIVSLGYPASENKFIDRYEEEKVHYNKY